MTPPPPPPPPRTPSRYNLRRRPSTATPGPRTPRMLRCLDADEQLRQHPPSEPRLLRSANKKRPVTADPSVTTPTPQPRRPSTAPLATVPHPSSPSHSSLPLNQPIAAEPSVSTPPVRRRRPSTAPPSDRVLRSSSRTRQREPSQEPRQSSSRKSDASRSQLPSQKRLTARARAFLPHPLNSSKPEAVDNVVRVATTQRRQGRSPSKTRSRPPQIENSVPKRERSRSRSQVRTIRTRSQSTVKPANNISTEDNVSPDAEGLDGTMRRLFHGAQRFPSSSPDFSKWMYQDLLQECKKNGLPYHGKKNELLNRLQRFHTRSAGALARRTAVDTRGSVKSKTTNSDQQEILHRSVSGSKLLSEREEKINPTGEQKKEDDQDKVEDNTDVVASEQHIGVHEDNKLPLTSGQGNNEVTKFQNTNETKDDAGRTLSEKDTGESPGQREDQKDAEEPNCSNVPLITNVEDEKRPPVIESSREQVSELEMHQSYSSNHTQQCTPMNNEGTPTQQESPKEPVHSGVSLKNENEQLSIHGKNLNSPQEHTTDLEENEVASCRQEQSDTERQDCPSASKVEPENVPLRTPSKDEEREAQSPTDTPPSGARSEVEARSLAEEKIPEPQDGKSCELHDKDIENTSKYLEVAVDDQTNSVQRVCQRINNVGSIQFEPAREHMMSAQIPTGSLNTEGNEFHFSNQLVMTEAKDGPSAQDVSIEGPQSSLPERQRHEQQVNEAGKSFEHQAASQSPSQREPQETVAREIFSRWRRPPIEGKDEVAQTPDVIDLDAESDGNDDDEDEDSRHCNSDSNENSGYESQRPETVIHAEEDEEDDDDDDDDGNQTPRRDDDINENKLPDTDEDNDEDEDDDEGSDANDDSLRSDACELTAEEGEGPQPIDITLNERAEESQAANHSYQKAVPPAIEINVHDDDNCRDNDESKASTLDGTALLPQKVVDKPVDREQVKTLHSTEQDRDEVIDLQEDSRMGEDEEDEEELDYADNTDKPDEVPSDGGEKIFSAAEKRKKSSTLREKGEESDAVFVHGSSEVHSKEELTAREVVEPSPHNDPVQESGAASVEFGEINADCSSSPDLRSEGVYLSAEEREFDDRGEETHVARKGLIKPELKGDDMSLSEEERHVGESGDESVVAQKGVIKPNDAQEEEDEQEERGDEMLMSHCLETQETEEPGFANLEERESPKVVGVGLNPIESHKLHSEQSQSTEKESNDDLGEFSESPLPSPNPPRSHSEGPQGDDFLKSERQIVSRDHGDSVVEDKNESETPEGDSEEENVVRYQSETLDENYPSSDMSRADEDRSQSIAELRSDDGQNPSEDLSSHVEDPSAGENDHGRIPTSRGSSPGVHVFTGTLSSDPGQEQGENENPNVGLNYQHGRITNIRESSPDVRDNLPSDPRHDQGENGRDDEESPDMICIISSDDDEPGAETSTGAATGELTNKNGTLRQKGQDINEGLEGQDGEDKHVRDTPLQESDVNRHTRSGMGPVWSKLEREHIFVPGYDDNRIPKTDERNQGAPLPTNLLHKTSQTASRNSDFRGFRIPFIQRSDSALSASRKGRRSFEEAEMLPPRNPMLSRNHKAEPPYGAKARRDLQTSTRLNSDLVQGRELNDGNAYKAFESDILPRDQNLAEDRRTETDAPHGNSGKRPFEQVHEFCNEDQRPRKIRKKHNMVEFVPMPTPESTIQAFGRQQMMNERHDAPHHQQKSSSILDRLRKIQEVEQQGPSLSFRLPPLTATLGQMYNPQQHQSEPVMFRQGSITSIPKKNVRRLTTRSVPEYDRMSFLEESRRRLEAHKRRAPSLQPSLDPFVSAPTMPSGSKNSVSSRAMPREAAGRRQSQVHFPGPAKRVTFQTEIPPSKRRRGSISR